MSVDTPEREMLKYVRYSHVFMAVFVPVCLAVSIALIIAGSLKISGIMDLPVSWPALPVGLFLLGFVFVPSLSYRRMINFLRDNGIYQEAVTDFTSAKPFMNDRMRMGDKYLFCKKKCVILRYYDISKVFQEHDFEIENRREIGRTLNAIDVYGNVWFLCNLETNTDNQPGLKEALDFMLSKNNLITIES